MINVVHFDNAREVSKPVRMKLATSLDKSRIDYQDLTENKRYTTFSSLAGDLEKTLEDKDVLIVHPEIKAYGRIMAYPNKFPKLNVIFLIPGEEPIYEEKLGMKLYNYANIDKLMGFINNLAITS